MDLEAFDEMLHPALAAAAVQANGQPRRHHGEVIPDMLLSCTEASLRRDYLEERPQSLKRQCLRFLVKALVTLRGDGRGRHELDMPNSLRNHLAKSLDQVQYLYSEPKVKNSAYYWHMSPFSGGGGTPG